MALSASSIFQIQSTATASNVNSGGFNPANANMLADLTTDANTANTNSPVCSSASYNFVAGDVGHWLYIKSGTNWTPGWYKIASVASNKATLSATVGSAIQVSTANNFDTNTVAGCATVGTPTAGTFTIDYSQSNAAAYARTDLVIATTTTLTSAAIPFSKIEVGNLIHITAGTGFTVGWYEIVSVTGVTATVDRVCGTLASTGGTGNVGGALSLGSSDDAVFELAVASATASTRYFIKGGSNITYALGGTVTIAAGGNAAWNVIVEGFVTNRGDRPTGATRPLITTAANVITFAANWDVGYLKFSGTATIIVTLGGSGILRWSKITNTSTSSSAIGFSGGTGAKTIFCEFIAPRSIGASSGSSMLHYGGYFHDCNVGYTTGTSGWTVANCVFVNCVTACIDVTAVPTGGSGVFGCTFYGAENKLGIAVKILTATRFLTLFNNIFYGFVTAVSHPDVNTVGIDDYNCYYNNTTDSTTANWQKGKFDSALNPTFTSVNQRTGTTATTTSGNHLVQTGATFQTWGVTTSDFLHIISGTGVTVGIYDIASVDSETQITTTMTLTANATADKTWQITTGRNLAIGTNLKGLGFPGVVPGGLQTGYMDMGAVQRQEAGGGTINFLGGKL